MLKEMSPDEVEWVYNALDCCLTHEIYDAQSENLTPHAEATERFSLSLLAPVMEMSLRGTRINERERQKVLGEYRSEFTRVRRNLRRITSEGIGLPAFNFGSPKQVGELFYDVLGFKEIKGRSTSGRWSRTTDRDALEKLQENFLGRTLSKHILTLRELQKKINFLETPRDDDGRLRSSYNVAGTKTGRLNSSESDFGTGGNNQNIERRLRKVFIPDDGYKFCNIDLEQADSRNVGAICWQVFVDTHGEAYAGSYLDACESGDLHTTVCRMAWRDLSWGAEGASDREVADRIAYREFSYRDMSKRLGHGTNFYGTPRTMAHHTKVETKVIKSFQERYFDAFPVLGDAAHTAPKWHDPDTFIGPSHGLRFEDWEYNNWHQYVRVQLETTGAITTPFYNRRRFFYGRPDDTKTLRDAIAYAPQSMTADAIDTGIIRLWRALPEVHLLIQVHDSILFQYPEHREAEIIPMAIKLLTITHKLKRGRVFGIPVEAKIGWNWADKAKDNLDGLTAWIGPGADERKTPTFTPGTITLGNILEDRI